jgi:hypothetical protein
MQKIIVNVPDELHKVLRARREATDVPTSVFIRRALEKALAGTPTDDELKEIARDRAAESSALEFAPRIEKRFTTPALIVPGGGK